MKRSSIYSNIIAVFLSLLVSSGGFAQEVQQVEEIKGKMIEDQQGRQLGKVEEVRVGPDGKIESVVVEKGGFFGIGGETNTIPWKSLTMSNDGSLVFNQGSEQAQASSPEAASQQQQSQAQSAQGQQESRQDKGQQATAQQGQQGRQDQQGTQQGQIVVQQPGAQVQVDQAEPKVSVSQPQPKVTVTQPPPQVKVQVEQPKPEVTVQQPQPKVDVQQQKPEVVVKESKPQVQVEQAGQPQVYLEDQQKAQVEVQRQGQPQVDVVTSGQQQGSRMDPAKADQLMGRKIVGKNGQELGTLKEKHLSQDGQSVQYLIVQGEDNKMHPVPAALVNADQKGQQVTAQIDKETFQKSPNFSPEQKPQLDQQQWSRQINSYYGMAPAWQNQEKQGGAQSGQQQTQEPSEKQPKK